jgi:MtN3 and saliva related transmembrane protein
MTEIIGYFAAFLTTASFLPQVLKALKTKDTTGISLIMYLMFISGVILWLIYGILLENKIIIFANLITLILAGIVLLVKIKNVAQGLK